MLSVAQAVHHPETPGSSSKHSALGHSWPSDRPNTLKRRKTEGDCCTGDNKTIMNSVDLAKQYHINNQEITLTIVPKKNSQNNCEELIHGNIKAFPVFENNEVTIRSIDDKLQDTTDNDRISTNMPPVFVSLIENSEEIQLFKSGSTENIRLVCQDEIIENNDQLKANLPNEDQEIDKESEQMNNLLDSNSISEFSEITIEPCTNVQKSKLESLPTSPLKNKKLQIKTDFKTQSRLDKAQEMLKKKKNAVQKPISPPKCLNNNSTDTQTETHQPHISTRSFYNKTNVSVTVPEKTFVRPNSPAFDEEPDQHVPVSSSTDYEPFNVGISCDCFYGNNQNKPYHANGFPNPPGENRCWINATLHAIFTLPFIDKLDLLDMPECSKLMASLSSVQALWRKGNTESSNFEQTFCTFKEDLSALDRLYSSKAQQDVSEFVLNLLNFIKTEFESMTSKQTYSNEIENIPNNEQDSLQKPQSNKFDSNKRSPLSDISVRQLRSNSHSVSSAKTNSSSIKSKNNQIETTINPIDEYFLLYMVESYTCDNCSKQRQLTIENLMLFIDVPSEDNGNTENLTDMINVTYALEHRDMTCESCKHPKHSLTTKFKKCPKILTVQVNRYQMSMNGIIKKSTLVEIPSLLRLDSLVINNTQDFSHFPEYEPICIISHIGDSIDSGHYISFVKHEDQWFYYDDLNVKIVSAEEVFKCVQNNAYVIFFQDTELRQNINTEINQKNKKESIAC